MRKKSNRVDDGDGRSVAHVKRLVPGKDDVDEMEKQSDKYILLSRQRQVDASSPSIANIDLFDILKISTGDHRGRNFLSMA